MNHHKNLPNPRTFQRRRRSYSTLLGHRVARRYPAHLSSFSSLSARHKPISPRSHPNNTPPQHQTEREAQRQTELERELQLARDIQQGLLLATVPHLPGWELSAVSLPAHDLGGDLYDFLSCGEGLQGIMIGDVAGKGLPAALQMAVTRTVFRHEARQGHSSAVTLAAVNRGVLSEIPQGMVTMLYALLDPVTGMLRIANAGHTFPILMNNKVQELEVSGLPLGIDTDSDYDELIIVIEPGDTIVLYSDGVTEALNEKYEMFGLERLQQILTTHHQLKPRALMTILLHELRAWGTAPSDDLTIVVLRRRLARLGDEVRSIFNDVLGEEDARALWAHLTQNLRDICLIDATCDEWSEMLPIVARTAQEYFGRGLARELNQQLRLAIEEYR